ncbi:cell division protein FtsQ/DivIB, partial [bacterium]|nr:cell division protein FtsQ/DivIB [bacterium]
IDSLQIGIGSRIFGVNLEKPRHKLEKNLFFDEVAILRSLPSTISVIIKEKVLVAWVDWENENLLLSNEGILLPHLPPTGVRNLPLISGVKPDSTKIGEVSKNKDLILAKDFLLAFDRREDENFVKNDLKTKISQIVVSVNEGMTIFLTSFNTPVIIGSDNFDVKIEKLSTFLKEMENESKSKFDLLEHIDLRYENQIVVKKKVNKNRVSNEKN